MASITLKTIKRKTSVSRAKIREAVSAAYAQPMPELNPPVVVRVTKKTSPKHHTSKAS